MGAYFYGVLNTSRELIMKCMLYKLKMNFYKQWIFINKGYINFSNGKAV